ncbi:MAG: hypothetical protein ABIN89_28890 [Chitinophagaceae bacterium]
MSGNFFKKPVETIAFRDTLFGDLPLNYWAGIDSNAEPWTLFKEVKRNVDKAKNEDAIKILNNITAIPGLESRQYLQAYHFLNNLAAVPEHNVRLYGIVVEVSMDQGTDLLAVYADYSARYYNYSGKSVIWEHPDNSIDGKIDHVMSQGEVVVAQVGPWKEPRLPVPSKGFARVNFLTSHGIHFGEARQMDLFNDPLAGKLMYAMFEIMETLISKTEAA